MKTYTLDKGIQYKLFMLIAFSLFSLIMYQGYLKNNLVYSIIFYIGLFLCAFQIATIFYAIFVKRVITLNIDDSKLSWEIFDNKKLFKKQTINLKDIKEVKTEINYLTGNIYSNFTVTFVLNNNEEILLSDGLFYDFGLKKAEDLCKYLLDNNLGDPQDIKFSNLIKELKIDLTQEQIFNKKENKSYFVGVISKNKKEFLSLRLQIENLYPTYKIIEKNANNEYLIKSEEIKNSYIYLRSNAIGYLVEFHNVSTIKQLKTLKQMGKRNKIGF